tara:strand:+ start:60395 stop:60913 length:519 start_codon:yes stop_codon:yes gene_type:complete
MSNNSIKISTRYRQTDRKKALIKGVLLSLLLIATPFIFYIYKYAPSESKEWETIFGTITARGFSNVQTFMHATFTKFTFVLITGMWFLTSSNWWKFAILVPFTMFLFQFIGVLNYELQYIDEFDFWYSLPIILPILFFLIYISVRISKRESLSTDLKSEVDDEIKKMLSDEL